MSTITILHISDLHHSKAKLETSKALVAGLIADLKDLEAEYDLKPDLFFFTGDLVQSGKDSAEDFRWVSGNVVDPILDVLNLNAERFFCVPGNHEIDRSKVYDEIELGLAEKLNGPEAYEAYYSNIDFGSKGHVAMMEKLDRYYLFEEAYRKETKIIGSQFYSGYKFELKGLTIGIGCLNSAWRSSHLGTDKRRLVLGRTNVENLGLCLKDCDIRLALCHHPFDWLAEWDEKQVKRRIGRHFDMLFNGHIHDSEPSLLQQSFGGFYTSTAGCMNGGGQFSHYSVVRINLETAEVSSFLREWYPDRGVFDQETAKGKEGVVTFNNFKVSNPETAERIQLHKYRQKISEGSEDVQLVNPWEGIVQLSLNDVFVEPVICDTSSLNRSQIEPGVVALEELLKGPESLFFLGRQESGKTLLLKHIEQYLLSDKPEHEHILPVQCKFSQLPRNNAKKIVSIVCEAVDNEITADEAITLLINGRVVLLVDDLADRNNPDCAKRCKTLALIFQQYPKIRIIATIQEYMNQQLHADALFLQKALLAKIVYIWPFNTAKLKQLLQNISKSRQIDINRMLEQIVFYFHHLQIPVTPLAATLFIGVLFRDPKQRNIQNEAYLIENYLESILEKLDGDGVPALDFRDKESFLAHLAWRMVELESSTLTLSEFEEIKSSYFKELEESLPPSRVFKDFFKKGILVNSAGNISFKFRFWYYFFLAKAFEKSQVRQDQILDRVDYLSFSTAIAYKAGLVRNDYPLLQILARRLDREIASFQGSSRVPTDRALEVEEQLQKAGKAITATITAKLADTDTFEQAADGRFTICETEDNSVGVREGSSDALGELLTLHADVLRNSREITGEQKSTEVIRSVEGFLSLMWGVISGVQDLVVELSEQDLERLFFQKMIAGSQKERMAKMLAASQKMVYQMVPVSFAFFMCDHLCNPKLASVMERCSLQAKTDAERLFYYFLLFKCDPELGYPKLLEFARNARKGLGDVIAAIFLRVYSYETPLDEEGFDRVITLLSEFRQKNISVIRNAPPFIQDTFREDVVKAIIKNQRKKGRIVKKRRKRRK